MKEKIKENAKEIIILSILIIAVAVFVAWVQLTDPKRTSAATEDPNAIMAELQDLNNEITTTPPVTTTPPPITTTPPPETTAPPAEDVPPETTIPQTTTAATVEQTLAPVQTISEIEMDVIQQFDTEIDPASTTIIQTTPPPEAVPTEQIKYVDGVKYKWHPILGWSKSSGDGSTIIMEVESSGEYYDASW